MYFVNVGVWCSKERKRERERERERGGVYECVSRERFGTNHVIGLRAG